MKVTSKEQPPREAVLTIQLEPPEVEPYLERAYRRVVLRANIPGFRKGKAPRRIVEQLLGRDYLLSEALEFMVPEVTNKAVAESALEVGGLPSVNVEQLDPPNIVATVPLTPTVDLGAYQKLRIAKPDIKITAAQVDEELERIRWSVVPWEPVEEPVAMEDLLNVTVKGRAGDKEVLNMERADYVPREEARVPAPGFSEALVGMKAYETKEFTIDVPEEFEYPEVAGKSCRFEVTVHIVKRKKPSLVDDEFAKGVGNGYESLADMRAKIEAEFAQNEERLVESRHQEEALDKVLEGATFIMSSLIVDHELEHLLADHQEALQTGRMSIEQYRQYLSWAGKSAEEIRDAARPDAESRVKRSLVLEKVSGEHKLEVSDDEVTAEVDRLVQETGSDEDRIRELFKDAERQDSLRRLLLNRKAVDFLSNLVANGAAPSTKAPRAAASGKQAAKKSTAKPKRKGKQA